MDTLSKEVSDLSLGPKWHQLYIRLGLEPRKRFSITVEHKDKTGDEKVRCCVLDTIALWRRTEAVQKMKEREMMKQLLVALQQVQGFETIALQLSESHGVELGRRAVLEPDKSPLQHHSDSLTGEILSDHTLPNPQQTISNLQDREGGMGTYGSNTTDLSRKALPPDSSPSLQYRDIDSRTIPVAGDSAGTGSEHDIEEESGSSFSVNLSSISEREQLFNKQALLQVPIDMTNKVHKFAILDVVQRISIERWTQFTSLLGLSEETIQVLSRKRATEEKYYHAIKEWLRTKNERATFMALNDFLEQCSEHGAQVIMKMRLEYNRDVLEGATP